MYNGMVKVLIKVCKKGSAGGRTMVLKIQYCCHSFIFFSEKQKPLGHIKTHFENQRSDPAKPFSSRQVLGSTLSDSGGGGREEEGLFSVLSLLVQLGPIAVGHPLPGDISPAAPCWFLYGQTGSMWLWDNSGWKGPCGRSSPSCSKQHQLRDSSEEMCQVILKPPKDELMHWYRETLPKWISE